MEHHLVIAEVELTRDNLKWNYKPFEIPKYIYKEWSAIKSGAYFRVKME
jgi:transketolase